jgi:hypothetical protein
MLWGYILNVALHIVPLGTKGNAMVTGGSNIVGAGILVIPDGISLYLLVRPSGTIKFVVIRRSTHR